MSDTAQVTDPWTLYRRGTDGLKPQYPTSFTLAVHRCLHCGCVINLHRIGWGSAHAGKSVCGVCLDRALEKLEND